MMNVLFDVILWCCCVVEYCTKKKFFFFKFVPKIPVTFSYNGNNAFIAGSDVDSSNFSTVCC